MKIQADVYYIEHPLADIWVGVTAVQGEWLLLVDSATAPAAGETILPYLAEHGLTKAGQPVLVVNTHCHCDHIGGNAELQTALDATIAAHKADADFVESRSTQLEGLFGPFHDYGDLAIDPEKFLAVAGADTPVNCRLKDGDRLDQGRFQWEVIHTPGHSAGSIALYEPAQGLLLVSDSVQGAGTTDTEVPLIVDLAAYRNSMRRLAELDVGLLVAAHPFKPYATAVFRGPAAIQFVRESEAIASEYLQRVARLISARSGPVSLLDLGAQLAQEVGLAGVNPFLLMFAAACLDELAASGHVLRLSGTGWQPISMFSVPR